MHKVTFYPIGNADGCLIELDNGRNIVFDFADVASKTDDEDKRIDLEKALRAGSWVWRRWSTPGSSGKTRRLLTRPPTEMPPKPTP